MKKTYELFKSFLPLIITSCALCSIFGFFAIHLHYSRITFTLDFPRVISVMFYGLVFISAILCIAFSFMAKGLTVTGIRKKGSPILTLASVICSVLIFLSVIMFIVDSVKGNDETQKIQIIKAVFAVLACGYFIVSVLPRKTAGKKSEILLLINKILGVCVIIYPISSLFCVYFSNSFTTTGFFKITQILIYALFSIFFLYEVEFDYLIPKHSYYILSALLSVVAVSSFSVSAVFYRIYKSTVINGFMSDIEILCSIAIGFYAFARFVSVFQTAKFIIDEKEKRDALPDTQKIESENKTDL